MNTLVNLLKDHQLGKWCKVGAWIVLAVGIINIILDVYTTVSQYNNVPFLRTLPSLVFWMVVRIAMSPIPTILFYFFVLYAVGVVVDRFVGGRGMEEEDDMEDVILDEEDDEEITSGQMR